jgi:hypothetical protein
MGTSRDHPDQPPAAVSNPLAGLALSGPEKPFSQHEN